MKSVRGKFGGGSESEWESELTLGEGDRFRSVGTVKHRIYYKPMYPEGWYIVNKKRTLHYIVLACQYM